MRLFNPTWYIEDICSIDLNFLLNQNVKVLMFDLDNTIVKPHSSILEQEMFLFLQEASRLFKVYIISNNKDTRVKKIADEINASYLASARKPTKSRLKRFLLSKNALNSSTVLVGDQLLTDIWCANKLNIRSILVEPLDRRDLVITKFNRFIDRRLRKRALSRGLYEKL